MNYAGHSLIRDICECFDGISGDEWSEAFDSLRHAYDRDEMWSDEQKDWFATTLITTLDEAHEHFLEYTEEELEEALRQCQVAIISHREQIETGLRREAELGKSHNLYRNDEQGFKAALAMLPDWVKADPPPKRDRPLERLAEVLRPVVLPSQGPYGPQLSEERLTKLAEECRRALRGY